MEKVLVGKYVKTHGIKGEIKIKSNFKYKEKAFSKGNMIYLNDQEFMIDSYRPHQEYDMLTLKGITNINQILPLKGSFVYVLKNSLSLEKDEYLDSDLIHFSVYMSNSLLGKVSDIVYINDHKKLLLVNNHYIPFELIQKIDFKNQKIDIEEVEGLI